MINVLSSYFINWSNTLKFRSKNIFSKSKRKNS